MNHVRATIAVRDCVPLQSHLVLAAQNWKIALQATSAIVLQNTVFMRATVQILLTALTRPSAGGSSIAAGSVGPLKAPVRCACGRADDALLARNATMV